MSNDLLKKDSAVRQEVLDVKQSFILQAPAGSGKTELLTQRFLSLLGQAVTQPEEIIAITFTKKSANEMQTRIIQSLEIAKEDKPSEPHKITTWQLAQTVLQQDKKRNWQLLSNPKRLRIMTIDALCHYLVSQLPILANFGAQPQITDDAYLLYQQAANNILAHLQDNALLKKEIILLANYLNNDLNKIQRLLINMLETRSHWLPYLFALPKENGLEKIRFHLEKNMQETINIHLSSIKQAFEQTIFTSLSTVFHALTPLMYACSNDATWHDWLQLTEIPAANHRYLSCWQSLSDFLLTKDNTLRKTFDARIGFPSPAKLTSKQDKDELKTIKSHLASIIQQIEANEKLLSSLINIQTLPPAHYHDDEWELLKALITTLPYLAAELKIVFQQSGNVDFTEISHAANYALHDNTGPTDLAMRLDYTIKHLLIDEFQDTSIVQYDLLENITANWQPDDGKTLFLVGDPMQSIYRFRQAEVGLFIKVQESGISQVKLKSRKLHVNFRATEIIISNINCYFSKILPKNNHVSQGAISYSESIAYQTEACDSSIQHHVLVKDQDDSKVGEIIVNLCQSSITNHPDHSIVILVRSRSHLIDILPSLSTAKLDYQAVEIERLLSESIIQDLFALSRALLNLADSIAWLTILRSPWCGLDLAELNILCNDEKLTVWEQLSQSEKRYQLQAVNQQRISKVIAVLRHAFQLRGQLPLHQWIKQTWIALDGNVCIVDENDSQHCEAYFQLLYAISQQKPFFTVEDLYDSLQKLYAKPNLNHNAIQVMTIHKAKGLEFDTVIIPHLEKISHANEKRLLLCHEQLRYDGSHNLLFAPIKPIHHEENKIYEHIQAEDNKKDDLERARLLYVAMTRAKKNIHLISTVSVKDNEVKMPNKKSFLFLLWPLCQDDVKNKLANLKCHVITSNDVAKNKNNLLKRLPIEYFKPVKLTTKPLYQSIANNPFIDNRKEYISQQIGIIIHRYLCLIANDDLQTWSKQRILHCKKAIIFQLHQSGVPLEQHQQALDKILLALNNALTDENGRWILSKHLDAQSEYAISIKQEDDYKQYIIDRTFIDKHNHRWIIDYKSSTCIHNINQLALLKPQYQTQLENYAHAFHLQENRPIQLGLYFPLSKSFIKWAAVEQS